MSATANEPTPSAPPAPSPDLTHPEPATKPTEDPEKGRVPPVTPPGRSEHPKQ